MKPVLILGGSSKAYELAELLTQDGRFIPTTSLAGRTPDPKIPPGLLRQGGFGGADGLARYLAHQSFVAIIDATHPFAARMGHNAHQAAQATNIPLLRLEPSPWHPGPGDRWEMAPDSAQAAQMVPPGARAFLAVGRQDLAPFAARTDVIWLGRSVVPPDLPLPWITARGPFSELDEMALFQQHRIQTLICKNSGGPTDAKLSAARRLGLGVIMIERPTRPGVERVEQADQVLEWLVGRCPTPRKEPWAP